MNRRPRVFYGWVVATALAVLTSAHRRIATIVTFMTMLLSVASGTYTYLAGLDYDLLGNYQVALGFAAILGALAFVTCWRIRMLRFAVQEAGAAVAAG